MRVYVFILFLVAAFVLGSCANQPKQKVSELEDTIRIQKRIERLFNEDSAYQFVEDQVNFGPRVPGSSSHLKCYNYLFNMLQAMADTVYVQKTTGVTYDMKTIPIYNLIASFNRHSTRRILLCAHWDTRPFADQDTKNKDQPILGANDGASGVGVLLEVAKQLHASPSTIGVDIVFFDSEDWGDNSGKKENSYCLGSQYWSKNLHVPNYKADFGILLDMVGAPNALFGFEGYSLSEAQPYLSMVWSVAQESGYSNYFKNFERGFVTDDHYYVMKNTRIPVIDIIDTDPTTSSHFGKYWHTHQDNMDAIDKKTLKAVGQTLLNVISRY